MAQLAEQSSQSCDHIRTGQGTDKLYHIMLYRVHLDWAEFEHTTLVVIVTDYIDSCKSNYHTITTTAAPFRFCFFLILILFFLHFINKEVVWHVNYIKLTWNTKNVLEIKLRYWYLDFHFFLCTCICHFSDYFNTFVFVLRMSIQCINDIW
jgi:hypothetical protein